jgi:hypothetical protein
MKKTNFTRSVSTVGSLIGISVLLWISGCKKSEVISSAILKDSTIVTAKKTIKLNEVNSQADAAFNAINTSFLTTSGSTQYYKTALNNTATDYFWCQALDIQMVEDTYLRTKSSSQKDLITNLLNTFLQQNQGQGGLYDWNWNDYNDDLLWAGIAFARGYQITGNVTFLNQAKYAFNRAYDRGWDNSLGGGIWWDVTHQDKSGLSNNTAVILGCYIYELTKESAYLTKASAVYDWIWLTLYNRTTGAVYENITPNGTVSSVASVYNAGAFIGAANQLHRITGRLSLYDDAKRAVDYVRANETTNGIFNNPIRNGSWSSEFARGLGEFVRDNNLWSTYYSWMKQNVDAAWAARRTDRNITWNNWLTTTPSDNVTGMLECISAVVMQQVTPAAQPGLIDNAIYRLTPKNATGSSLSINMQTNLAELWQWIAGSNEKFQLKPLGNGYYRLVPQSATSSSLNVAGGSAANSTAIQISSTIVNSSQYFKLIYDYDGYYKLKPQCAPMSCVNVQGNGTANGTKCILWQESFADNERWLMEKQ